MYWLERFVCSNPECGHEFDELLDKGECSDIHKFHPKCPVCSSVSDCCTMTTATHHKHYSWTTWRKDHS